MQRPTGASEQARYSTVQIVTVETDGNQYTGTGFLFHFESKDAICPAIIANRHVIADAKSVTFRLHLAKVEGGERWPSGTTHTVTVAGSILDKWAIVHPRGIDLCALPVAPIISMLEAENKAWYYIAITPSLIPSQEQLNDLRAIEDITMVGYPNGLWDKANNFPLMRRGITATHPADDYNGDSVMVVDIACFPGSSGSPVFLLNEGQYTDKRANVYIGTDRIMLLGILSSGPTIAANGEVVMQDVPTRQAPVATINLTMHLGYVIKAKELIELGNRIMGTASSAA